jgi:hypothetical protein
LELCSRARWISRRKRRNARAIGRKLIGDL